MDLLFYVPNTGFMMHPDYEIFDAILTTYGFADEGVVQMHDHVFRKYWLNSEKVDAIPANLDGLRWFYKDLPHDVFFGSCIVYTEQKIPFIDAVGFKLQGYGLNYMGEGQIGDKTMYQYAIEAIHLPVLARICPAGLRPSKRMVEENSYFKFIDRGYGHGMDLADWFAAEWECEQRLKDRMTILSEWA